MRVHTITHQEQRRAEIEALRVEWTRDEIEALEREAEQAETLTEVGVSDVSREFGVSSTAVARRLRQLGFEIAVVIDRVFAPDFGVGGRFLDRRVTRLSRVQLEVAEAVAIEVKLNGQRRNGRCRIVKE